jgi:hypothetical protein
MAFSAEPHLLRLEQSLVDDCCDHCDTEGSCITFDLLALGIVQLCESCVRRAVKILEHYR